MSLPSLLLALTTVIFLQSGDRIVVDGDVREENGVVIFRVGDLLYSIPARDVERIATLEQIPEESAPAEPNDEEPPVRRMRVSGEERQRLIAELEKNHSGTPSSPLRLADVVMPPPTPEERAAKRDEWAWRRQARSFEEAVTRARENLELLESHAQELQSRILGLVSLGYRANQFTYDTTQLARTREQIPQARLAVQRAERAWAQFREDARRQGILPGWLR